MTPFAGPSEGRQAGDSLYKWDIRDTEQLRAARRVRL